MGCLKLKEQFGKAGSRSHEPLNVRLGISLGGMGATDGF